MERRTSRDSEVQDLVAFEFTGRKEYRSSNRRPLLFLYGGNLRALPLELPCVIVADRRLHSLTGNQAATPEVQNRSVGRFRAGGSGHGLLEALQSGHSV